MARAAPTWQHAPFQHQQRERYRCSWPHMQQQPPVSRPQRQPLAALRARAAFSSAPWRAWRACAALCGSSNGARRSANDSRCGLQPTGHNPGGPPAPWRWRHPLAAVATQLPPCGDARRFQRAMRPAAWHVLRPKYGPNAGRTFIFFSYCTCLRAWQAKAEQDRPQEAAARTLVEQVRACCPPAWSLSSSPCQSFLPVLLLAWSQL